MIPLIVLLSVFILCVVAERLRKGRFDFAFPARLAMAAMLIFTAIGHFIYVEGMGMMIPSFIPYKSEIVYITGALEIILAILLLIQSTRKLAGRMLVIFFIGILPANIYAAINHIDYQKASYEGPGIEYLWFRIPLQIFFIGWVYMSAIKNSDESDAA